MSRVANDTAWKRRVLKEEAILERKNLALARTRLASSNTPIPAPSSDAGVNRYHKSESRQQDSRKTPSPSPKPRFVTEMQAQPAVESIRATSARKFDPTPRILVQQSVPDDAQSVSSYSSGTSIQSYPSTRQNCFTFSTLTLPKTFIVLSHLLDPKLASTYHFSVQVVYTI